MLLQPPYYYYLQKQQLELGMKTKEQICIIAEKKIHGADFLNQDPFSKTLIL